MYGSIAFSILFPRPAKVRWKGLEYISGFNSSLRVPFDPPRQVAIACFYISVFLFFETAWSYYSHVHQITESKPHK